MKLTGVSYQQLKNLKSQIPNAKQISMNKIRNPKQLHPRSYLRFGYCILKFIFNLVLVICYFRFIRV
jgi:hypothetical protein